MSSFSGEFFVSTLLLAIIILYFIFFSSRVVGLLVSKLLNALYFGKYDQYIHIGRLNIGILGGRILFEDVKYATKNTCIRIVYGSLNIRWWRQKVRESVQINADQRCRFEVALHGLEYIIFNNSYKFDELEKVIERRQSARTGETAKDTVFVPLPPVEHARTPVYYRLFPAISINIHKGAVMIGKPSIRHMAVLTFKKGVGLHTIAKPRSKYDYYKAVTNFDLTDVRLKVLPQQGWRPEADLPIRIFEAGRRREDFVTAVFSSFKSFFSNVRLPFIGTDAGADIPAAADGAPGRAADGGGGAAALASADSSGVIERDWDGLLRYDSSEYAHRAEVLTAPRINLKYHCDVQGPVPPEDPVFDPLQAPQWGIDAVVSAGAVITYGPWTEHQRSTLQSAFYPPDYEDLKEYRPVVGKPREFANFVINVTFEGATTVKMPFREPSKDWMYKNVDWAKREAGFVDFTMSSARLHWVHPWVMLNAAEGVTVDIDISLKNPTLETSLTKTPLVTCKSFKLNCKLRYPSVWNQLHNWVFTFSLKRPQLFFLMDHVQLFKDLVNDWGARAAPPDLAHFVPSRYVYLFTFTDFELYTNVNEENIIDKPNDLDTNAHYVFSGPRLDLRVVTPFDKYEAANVEVSFDVRSTNTALRLCLPTYNTVRQHLPHEDQAAGCQFIYVENFTLQGDYVYYTKVDPSYLDCVRLSIKGKNANAVLFGFFVRYFLLLKDNYFGYCSHIKTLEAYKALRAASGVPPGPPVPEANKFEIYVLVEVENATVQLPLALYNAKQCATIATREVMVEVRNVDAYTDLYVLVSPITVHVPIATREVESHLCATLQIENRSYIRIDGFTFRLHFTYGPRPALLTYHEAYSLRIGEISGHLVLSQLTKLATWGEQFVFHFVDADNKLSRDLIPQAYPVLSVVRLDVPHIIINIWGRESVTEIEMRDGLRLVSNSRICQLYHNKVAIELPDISMKHLIPNGHDLESWSEVGTLTAAFRVSIYQKLPNWESDAAAQVDYLRTQDSEHHIIDWLWQPEAEAESMDADVDVGTPPPQPPIPAAAASESIVAPPTLTVSTPETNPTASPHKPLRRRRPMAAHLSDRHALRQSDPAAIGRPRMKIGSGLLPRRRLTMSASSLNHTARRTPIDTGGLVLSEPPSAAVAAEDAEEFTENTEFYSATSNDGGYQTPEEDIADLVSLDVDDNDVDNTNGEDVFFSEPEDDETLAGSIHNTNTKDINTTTSEANNCTAVGNTAAENAEETLAKGRSQSRTLPQTSSPRPRPRAAAADVDSGDSDDGEDDVTSVPTSSQARRYLRQYAFAHKRALFSQLPSSIFRPYRRGVAFAADDDTESTAVYFSHECERREWKSSFVQCVPRSSLNAASKGKEKIKSPLEHARLLDAEKLFPRTDSGDQSSTSTTTIVVDSMRSIYFFATPLIGRVAEELLLSFTAKTPSVDAFLDEFQLRTLYEQFKVQKYRHSRTRVAAFVHTLDVRLLQEVESTLPAWPNRHAYIGYLSEIKVSDLEGGLALCETRVERSPTTPTTAAAAAFGMPTAHDTMVTKIDAFISLKSAHVCIRLLTRTFNRYLDAGIPLHRLHKLHTRLDGDAESTRPSRHPVVFSVDTADIRIDGRLHRPPEATSAASVAIGDHTVGAFSSLGPVTVLSVKSAAPVLRNVVTAWIDHVSSVVTASAAFLEVRTRQLQLIVCEIVRCWAARTSPPTVVDGAPAGHIPWPHMAIASRPAALVVIGEQGLLHRAGWQEISRLRYMFNEGMNNEQKRQLEMAIADAIHAPSPADAKALYRAMRRRVAGSELGRTVVDLVDSHHISRVFMAPPPANGNMQIDFQMRSFGVDLCIVDDSAPDNAVAIGTATVCAHGDYRYAAGRYNTLHTVVVAQCRHLGLKIGPDVFEALHSLMSTFDLPIHKSDSLSLTTPEVSTSTPPVRAAAPPETNSPKPPPAKRPLRANIAQDMYRIAVMRNLSRAVDVDTDVAAARLSGSSTDVASMSEYAAPTDAAAGGMSPVDTSRATSSAEHLHVDSPTRRHRKSSATTDSLPMTVLRGRRVGGHKRVATDASSGRIVGNKVANTAPPASTHVDSEWTTLPAAPVPLNMSTSSTPDTPLMMTLQVRTIVDSVNCMATSPKDGSLELILERISVDFNKFDDAAAPSPKPLAASAPLPRAAGSRSPGGVTNSQNSLLHSTLVHLGLIDLHLVEPYTPHGSAAPPSIFGMTVHDVQLQQVYSQKLVSVVDSGAVARLGVAGAAGVALCPFVHDIMLTFQRATVPVYISKLLLVRNFLAAWTPPSKEVIDDVITPLRPRAEEELKQAIENAKTLVRVNVDLRQVDVSVDVIASLPFHYEISRVLAAVEQRTPTHFDCTVQLLSHSVVFMRPFRTPVSTASEPSRSDATTRFIMPQLRAFATVRNTATQPLPQQRNVDINGLLEVGMLSTTVNSDLLNHVLSLQSSLSKEINDLLERYVAANRVPPRNAAKSGKSPRSAKHKKGLLKLPPVTTMITQYHYTLQVVLHGLEIAAAGDAEATLVFRTGKVGVKLRSVPPDMSTQPTMLRDPNAAEAVSPPPTGLLWQVSLEGSSLVMIEPGHTLSVSTETHTLAVSTSPQSPVAFQVPVMESTSHIWAGVMTSFTAQSFPENAIFGDMMVPRTRPPPVAESTTRRRMFRPLESVFMWAYGTTIIVQPKAIDKAAAVYKHYRQAYRQFQENLRRLQASKSTVDERRVREAIDTSARRASTLANPLITEARRNISISLKILETAICIPLCSERTLTLAAGLGLAKSTKFPGMLITLESLALGGHMSEVSTPAGAAAMARKEKKILGMCNLEAFSIGFIDKLETTRLQAMHKRRPHINRALIPAGLCRLSFDMSTRRHMRLFGEFESEGLRLDLDANIVTYISALRHVLSVSEEKWRLWTDASAADAVSTTAAASPSRSGRIDNTATAVSTTATFEIEAVLTTKEGRCVIHSTDAELLSLSANPLLTSILKEVAKSRQPVSTPASGVSTATTAGTRRPSRGPAVDRDHIAAAGMRRPSSNVSTHELILDQFAFPAVVLRVKHDVTATSSKASSQTRPPTSTVSTPDGGMASETTVAAVLESAKIEVSPAFAIFVHEIVERVKSTSTVPSSADSPMAASPSASLTTLPEFPGHSTLPPGKSAQTAATTKSPTEIETTPPQAHTATTAKPTNNVVGRSMTFLITFKPQVVTMTCAPTTEVVCRVDIGKIDLFLSTLQREASVNQSKRSVLLNNATTKVASAKIKLFHPMFAADGAELAIRRMAAHLGQANGLREDAGSVFSLLVDVDAVSGRFTLRHMNELLLFQQVWMNVVYPVDSFEVATAPPLPRLAVTESTNASAPPIQPPRPANSISLFVHAKIEQITLDGDLGQSIGDLHFAIDTITTNCGLPGRKEGVAEGDIMSATLTTGMLALVSNGRLKGSAKCQGITLLANRNTVAKATTGATVSAKRGENKAAFQIGAIEANLEYNLSQILLLRAGLFTLKLRDQSGGEFELPFALFKGRPFFSRGDALVDACVISENLQLQIACETIVSLATIVKRISENISQNQADAVRTFTALTNCVPKKKPARPIATVPSSAAVNDLCGPIGDITIRGSRLHVIVFGFSFGDHSWVEFGLESYQLNLARNVKKNSRDVHRQLSVVLGRNTLSHMTEREQTTATTGSPWQRQASAVHMLKIPLSTLIMYTIEKRAVHTTSATRTSGSPAVDTVDIDYWFLMDFTDSIEVSVVLKAYDALRDLVKLYKTTVLDVLRAKSEMRLLQQQANASKPIGSEGPKEMTAAQSNRETPQPHTSEPLAAAESTDEENDMPKVSAATSSGSTTNVSASVASAEVALPKRRFRQVEFQLEPTLAGLEDFTPKPATVMQWLGIKDKQLIPARLHMGVTDNVERLLKSLWDLSALMEEKL